ncbi:MAG: FtsQ-type POTRA domain-containing protein [Acidobacteria bacterium]|nr:FtsQ-type POTRA domain-containing protein [Acidobacteriota bacterium]
MAVELFDEIPELGAGEVSAVRRQTSAAPKTRSRKIPNTLRKKILLACGALTILAAVGYMVGRFALDDPHFRVTSVQVQGGKYITAIEVDDKFTADKDRSVLRVPLERRRRQVEQIPWVRSATVRRILPNSISVTVSERVPVAFVAGQEGIALIDQDGVFLDAPKDTAFHFPVVRGISEADSPASRRDKMRLFTALMDDLRRGGLQSSASISEVDVQDPQDARAVVSDSSGTVLVHLGKEKFLERYLIYLGHIDEWKKKFPSIRSVDLRYEGQVVVNADPQPELTASRDTAPHTPSKSTRKPQAH